MKTLSIIIPVYNEKETLSNLLQAVEGSHVPGLIKEIILVDDFSTDGTREILKDLAQSGKYKIFFHDKNCGKGSSLRLGFSKASGDFIIVQDADLEYDPKEYHDLLKPLLDGSADVVYGSRFLQNKSHGVLFFWHYIGNKILTIFSNMLTGLYLTDMETCYKVFTKEALLKITPDLTSDRFDIEPEITALVSENKLRVYEVGISYASRTYDEGKKINWKDGFFAIWTIVKSKYRFSSFGKDKLKSSLFLLLIFLSVFSIYALKPMIQGDSVAYVNAMDFFKTGVMSTDAVSTYRTLTTYLGLHVILLFRLFFGGLSFSWLFLNSILYITLGIFFYSLCQRLFNNSKISFLSALLLVTNYSAVSFGLSFMMDIGGWAFYISSLYFTLLYLQKKNTSWLFLSSLLIGLGGIWKEYAFLGYIVLFCAIVFANWKNYKAMFKYVFFTGLISFLPVLILNIYFYSNYHFSYLTWFSYQSIYVYPSRVVEYIKSFGSLYNFGWFLFIPGFYLLLKDYKKIFRDEKVFFICAVLISIPPAFLWGAITQRIIFIAVPGLVLVSALFLSKIQKKWYFLVPLFLAYILSSYLMDSYILPLVNVHSAIPFL